MQHSMMLQVKSFLLLSLAFVLVERVFTTNQTVTSLKLTRLLSVGQVDQSMVFLTSGPNSNAIADLLFYEASLTGLDTTKNRLSREEIKSDSLQHKWPTLVFELVSLNGPTMLNAITVRGLDNATYLFTTFEQEKSSILATVFCFDKDIFTKAQFFNAPVELLHQVWISSTETNAFYILHQEPFYTLAKYEFEFTPGRNEPSSIQKVTQNRILCTEGRSIYLTEDNCPKPVGPKYINWRVSRGSVNKGHFFLFGKELVYSFEASAFDNTGKDGLVRLRKTVRNDFVSDLIPGGSRSTTDPGPIVVVTDIITYMHPHPIAHGMLVISLWFLCIFSMCTVFFTRELILDLYGYKGIRRIFIRPKKRLRFWHWLLDPVRKISEEEARYEAIGLAPNFRINEDC